jgi:aspartyl-tRNA(Asn)/glutamyl-tRNA(Gln) amidotransferase subunit C
MISTEEIKKLADLARIEIEDTEAEKLATEIEAILGYVGQVSEFASSNDVDEVEIGSVYNVLREDINPTEPETYTKELVAEFPHKEDGYLKVKKILG